MKLLFRVALAASVWLVAVAATLGLASAASARDLTAEEHSIAQVYLNQRGECVQSDVLAGAIDRTFFSAHPSELSYVYFNVVTFDSCANDYVYAATPSGYPDAGYGWLRPADALTFNPQNTEARLRFTIDVITYTPAAGIGNGTATVDLTFTRENPHTNTAIATGTITLPDRTIQVDATYPASIFIVRGLEEGLAQ